MNKKEILQKLNDFCKNTLVTTLAIEFVELGEDFLVAKMPVNAKVHQPYGLLHGGATAALAETVASCASGFYIDTEKQFVNGIQLSINHIKSIREGIVFAKATVIHKGKSTHLCEVKIIDEQNELIAICKMTSIVLEKK